MSVIKTESGWVELGAANPLERAYETAGFRKDSARPFAARHVVNRVQVPLQCERIMADTSWSPEQVRAWNISLASKVRVSCCVQPCRCPNDCSCTFAHHSHKTDLRTLPAGVALFGKYGPEWAI